MPCHPCLTARITKQDTVFKEVRGELIRTPTNNDYVEQEKITERLRAGRSKRTASEVGTSKFKTDRI